MNRTNAGLLILLVAAPALAGGGAIIDRANNSLEACSQVVRTGIAGLQKTYPDLHFECSAGLLHKLFLPQDAPVFKADPEVFVLENWKLFFPKKPGQLEFRHQREFDNAAMSTANQIYKGVEVWNGSAYWNRPVRLGNEQEYGGLYSSAVDTSVWRFDTKAKITCDEAKKNVREYEVVNKVPQEGREYLCAAIPYIIKRSCDGKPAPIFQIEAVTRAGKSTSSDLRDRVMYPVDIRSGKVCRLETWL